MTEMFLLIEGGVERGDYRSVTRARARAWADVVAVTRRSLHGWRPASAGRVVVGLSPTIAAERGGGVDRSEGGTGSGTGTGGPIKEPAKAAGEGEPSHTVRSTVTVAMTRPYRSRP